MTDTATRWPHVPGEIPPFFDHPDRACAGQDTRLWFPEGGSNGTQAVAICRTCPLIDTCATWALQQPRLHGVWGGLTETARERHHRGTATPERPPSPVRRPKSPGATVRAVRAKVAAMHAAGYSVPAIADRVGYSCRTVQRHLHALGRAEHHGQRVVA